MGRRDIQAVYCLNNVEHEAFQMYWEGDSVPQIGQALNMTTSQAGKVLDEARDHVWGGMTEKRVSRGEATVSTSPEQHDSAQETTSPAGSSPGQYNLLSVRSSVDGPRKGSNH